MKVDATKDFLKFVVGATALFGGAALAGLSPESISSLYGSGAMAGQGLTAAEALAAGLTPAQALAAGLTTAELTAAGYTATQLAGTATTGLLTGDAAAATTIKTATTLTAAELATAAKLGLTATQFAALLYVSLWAGASDSPWVGYISDLRMVKTAVYTNNFVPPAAPLTAVQNTVLLNNFTNAAIADYSMMNNLETVGDAKLSTAVSKFGGTSMAFDGTGDYLSMPNSPNLSMATGDYTVEGWFYTTDNTQIQTIVWLNGNTASYAALRFGVSGSGGVQLYIGDNGTGPWYANSGNIGTVANNTWYHFAVSKSSTNVKVFLNGTQIGTTYTAPATAFAGTLNYVGALNYNDQGYPVYRTMYGYIDDLRITKGYARYTSNFTAPVTSFKTK
jgi:hypothetical protein